MTARELVLKQFDDSGNQLANAVKGLDAKDAEAKACAGGLTIYEHVRHVAEAALGLVAEFGGGHHEFGAWAPADQSWDGMKSAWLRLRAEAIAKMPDDDAALLIAARCLVGHENYHIGGIVTVRLSLQPEWDAYSIFED